MSCENDLSVKITFIKNSYLLSIKKLLPFNKPVLLSKKSQIAFKKRKRNDGCNPSSNNVQIIHGLVKLRNLAKHRPPSIQCSLSQIIMFVRFIYRAFYRNGFRVGANNKLDWEHEHPRANGGWWVHAVRLCTQESYILTMVVSASGRQSPCFGEITCILILYLSPPLPPLPRPAFWEKFIPLFSWKYHYCLGILKQAYYKLETSNFFFVENKSRL